jgi:hypothetical protein
MECDEYQPIDEGDFKDEEEDFDGFVSTAHARLRL